jgi:carboxyl-terminal processing protease
MNQLVSRLSASFLLGLVALVGPATTVQAGSSFLSCDALPMLVERLHEVHLEYKKPSKELDSRVVDLYLGYLDPSRSLLLESEAAAVSRRLSKAVSQVRKGNCTELDALQEERLADYKAMEEYVRKVVSKKKLKIDESVEMDADPDDRARPVTAADRDELRRQLVHVQLAGYVSRGMELDEAKRRLQHRYELLSRRVSEVEPADVYGIYLDSVARALDPHTTYFSADALEDFRIGMELSLEGIGAVLTQDDGFTVVREIVTGGAAHRQGQLEAGDKIVAVSQGPAEEEVDVVDMALRDVVRQIRGKKGTPVTLSVMRGKKTVESLQFTIVRDAINLEDQAASIRYETRTTDGGEVKLAVIELPGFYGADGPKARNSDRDVRDLLVQAQDEGASGVLLDLSRNGGGLLSHAVTISGLFLGTGPVVGVAGMGADEAYTDNDPSVVWDGPVAVLTSRGSASASEILAGALKDHGRAVLVGDEHTFGKGSVQNVVGLPPGFGALKVTIARFYRPNGQSTQNEGVPVDVVVRSPYDLPEIGERSLDYPLPSDRISPLTGGVPNPEGPGHWQPVTAELLLELKAASAERVAANDDMKELAELLDQAATDQPRIKVSELLSSEDEDEPQAAALIQGPDDDDSGDEDENTPTLQATEALNVLADLVRLQKGGS